MKVIFLRHGETTYNVKELISEDPKIDVPMTWRGKEQAKEIAKKFRGIWFDVIYVSEFSRTQKTAKIINQGRKIPLRVDKRLNDTRTGFEGMPGKVWKDATGGDIFHFKEKGKESWQDVKKRMAEFLGSLKNENYESVLAVSHQWPILIANQLIRGLSDEEAYKVPMGNCDFFEFEM